MRIKNINQLFSILDNKLRSADNILIISHTNPDPDCLFSQISLYYLLKFKYPQKKFFLFNKDYIYEKDILKLFNNDLILIKNNLNQDLEYFDLVIGIEITDEKRFGLEEKFIDYNKILIIDHHKSFSLKKCYYYLEENSESCSIIIFKLAKLFQFKLNLKFRLSILVGIIADTVGFRYLVNKETFLILSQIFDKRINIFKIVKGIYGFNFSDLKKFNYLINNIKINRKKKALIIFINENKKFKKINSFLEYFRLIKEIEIIILLKQKKDKIYGSLRSEKTDVSKIAKKLGGGGHKNSAGFISDLSAKRIIRVILNNI
ncbi:MAG: MGPA protein [Candidatus Parcubacteria bacterium]|nr:MAG: MGPA protein [Candidatus Parcubacteria bacterium]